MIPVGTPHPAKPPVLPGLAGGQLLAALADLHRRLTFVAEHLAHPVVPEGVADGIHDAQAAVRSAMDLQRAMLWVEA